MLFVQLRCSDVEEDNFVGELINVNITNQIWKIQQPSNSKYLKFCLRKFRCWCKQEFGKPHLHTEKILTYYETRNGEDDIIPFEEWNESNHILRRYNVE